MNRRTRDALAFGLGFLTGALLLAMLMALQTRMAWSRAFHWEVEAAQAEKEAKAMQSLVSEAEHSRAVTQLRIIDAEARLRQVEKELEQARAELAKKKD